MPANLHTFLKAVANRKDWRESAAIGLSFLLALFCQSVQSAQANDQPAQKDTAQEESQSQSNGCSQDADDFIIDTSALEKRLQEGCLTLPLSVSQGGQACVPACVNGREETVFLDSGSSANLIDPSLAHGLKDVGCYDAVLGMDCTELRSRCVVVPLVRIGNVDLKDVRALVVPMKKRGFAARFVIGTSIMRACDVTFDYPHRTVTFTRCEKFVPPVGAHTFSCSIDPDCTKNYPILLVSGMLSGTSNPIVQFAGEQVAQTTPADNHTDTPVKFMLDTGSRSNWTMKSLQVDSLTLGDFKVEKPVFHASKPGGFEAVLGTAFLRDYCVTFCYPKLKVYLSK